MSRQSKNASLHCGLSYRELPEVIDTIVTVLLCVFRLGKRLVRLGVQLMLVLVFVPLLCMCW